MYRYHRCNETRIKKHETDASGHFLPNRFCVAARRFGLLGGQFNRSFGMSLADGIIIFVIAIIVIAIIYFQFIRRSYSPCDSCPKKERCAGLNGESLKEYYRKVCAQEKQEE